MASYRITLRLEGTDPDHPHVRVSDFVHELQALRTALRKTEEIVSGQVVLDWQIVDLSHGSPATVVIEPVTTGRAQDDPTQGASERKKREVVSRFFGYARALTVRGEAPEELDRPTLEAFKALTTPVRHERVRASISNGADAFDVVGSTGVVIDAILAPKMHSSGSIEGRLEFINIHGGRYIFRVYPVVGPTRVECIFPKELLASAREGVGREVRVSGRVTYLQRDPFPHSILVEQIVQVPDDDDLPSILDIRGMAPNATGDVSSEEFVRDLRSGE